MLITTPPPDATGPDVAAWYRQDLDEDGFVFSHTRAMAVNPAALQAFESLISAVVPSIGVRVYELATLSAARAIGSPHCLLAHARKARHAKALDELQVENLAATVDITLAAAARNYFSRALRALAVPVEDGLAGLTPQLRRVLVAAGGH